MQEEMQIRVYNTGEQISSIDDLPVASSKRTCTDLFCTIMSAIFGIAIFIGAIAVMDLTQLQKITYPTDSQGRMCTLDNPNYNYLYFTSFTDPAKRLCVSQCPTGQQSSLKCWPTDTLSCNKNTNEEFEVDVYPSTQEETNLGLFCLPTDQNMRKQILDNANLLERFQFTKTYEAIWISLGVAFGMGILYITIICCAPTLMVYLAMGLGGVGCLAVAVFLFTQHSKALHDQGLLIIMFSIFMALFGVLCLWQLFYHSNDIQLCIKYLTRGKEILLTEQGLLLLIPLFHVLLIAVLGLLGFQLFAYWSSSTLSFQPDSVYYIPQGMLAVVSTIVNLVQFIWALCFLKQAFNFIVSGCAVTFFFTGDSQLMFGVRNLFRFHWGSVVAGSFLLNFFYLFDVIYDAIKPPEENRGCYKSFTSFCCCCERLLGFARGQAHSFINIVGLPYCNSARWCEYLNMVTYYFDTSQSTFRFYRVGAHVLLSLVATLFAYFYSAGDSMNAPMILFCFLLNLFIATFFICLTTDLAETLLLCDLIDMFLKGENIHKDLRQPQHSPLDESNVHKGYDIYPTNPE